MPMPIKIVLLQCGSFNPPTNMHLRLFEIARDHVHKLGNQVVVGGFISPVHDEYKKKDLIPITHRTAMLKLALQSSDWIKLSDWESRQEGWTKTRVVLNYHQNVINSIINSTSTVEDVDTNLFEGLCKNLVNGVKDHIQVKLLCGADLLESFSTPGLWSDEDLECILGQHGIVVISRIATDPWKFVYESDLLTKYRNNINIVTEWITNEISSTKVRRALKRNESVKYLLDDKVIDYIYLNNLYGSNTQNKYTNLIESPDDIIMTSPSPTNNCINNFCNNNLFQIGHTNNAKTESTQEEHVNNKANKSPRHPGQAIKILTNTTGHTLITNKEVCNQSSSLDQNDGISSKTQSAISLVEQLFVKRIKSAKSQAEIFV